MLVFCRRQCQEVLQTPTQTSPVLCWTQPPVSPDKTNPGCPRGPEALDDRLSSSALQQDQEEGKGKLTWNLPARMDVTHSTCKKQREGYLHTRNSSCRTSWDGLSPSALSQSPEHPALDQTPGEKAVEDELYLSNPDTESILNTDAARKIPFSISSPSLPNCWRRTGPAPKGHRNKPSQHCSPDTNP